MLEMGLLIDVEHLLKSKSFNNLETWWDGTVSSEKENVYKVLTQWWKDWRRRRIWEKSRKWNGEEKWRRWRRSLICEWWKGEKLWDSCSTRDSNDDVRNQIKSFIVEEWKRKEKLKKEMIFSLIHSFYFQIPFRASNAFQQPQIIRMEGWEVYPFALSSKLWSCDATCSKVFFMSTKKDFHFGKKDWQGLGFRNKGFYFIEVETGTSVPANTLQFVFEFFFVVVNPHSTHPLLRFPPHPRNWLKWIFFLLWSASEG